LILAGDVPIQLARIAIEEHLADAAQVAEAERHAARTGEPLVVALIEIAHISDAALARTLAARLGMGLMSLLDPEPDAIREVRHDLARRHRVLPLVLDLSLDGTRRLRVAMADPTDGSALHAIESSTGCRIEPALATLGAIDDAITRAYRGFVTVVMRRSELEDDAGGELYALPGTETRPPVPPLEDGAPPELRLRALMQLLDEKGQLTSELETEWLERIRLLLQHRE
jgi:Type II secretion system (T2SS), protein E, N-terminal domain